MALSIDYYHLKTSFVVLMIVVYTKISINIERILPNRERSEFCWLVTTSVSSTGFLRNEYKSNSIVNSLSDSLTLTFYVCM